MHEVFSKFVQPFLEKTYLRPLRISNLKILSMPDLLITVICSTVQLAKQSQGSTFLSPKFYGRYLKDAKFKILSMQFYS
jgi:hypothetical protein